MFTIQKKKTEKELLLEKRKWYFYYCWNYKIKNIKQIKMFYFLDRDRVFSVSDFGRITLAAQIHGLVFMTCDAIEEKKYILVFLV